MVCYYRPIIINRKIKHFQNFLSVLKNNKCKYHTDNFYFFTTSKRFNWSSENKDEDMCWDNQYFKEKMVSSLKNNKTVERLKNV